MAINFALDEHTMRMKRKNETEKWWTEHRCGTVLRWNGAEREQLWWQSHTYTRTTTVNSVYMSCHGMKCEQLVCVCLIHGMHFMCWVSPFRHTLAVLFPFSFRFGCGICFGLALTRFLGFLLTIWHSVYNIHRYTYVYIRATVEQYNKNTRRENEKKKDSFANSHYCHSKNWAIKKKLITQPAAIKSYRFLWNRCKYSLHCTSFHIYRIVIVHQAPIYSTILLFWRLNFVCAICAECHRFSITNGVNLLQPSTPDTRANSDASIHYFRFIYIDQHIQFYFV